jgi:hypothetical protein
MLFPTTARGGPGAHRTPHASPASSRARAARSGATRADDPEAKAWRVAKGPYELLVGASSRDIRLTGSVEVAKAALLK